MAERRENTKYGSMGIGEEKLLTTSGAQEVMVVHTHSSMASQFNILGTYDNGANWTILEENIAAVIGHITKIQGNGIWQMIKIVNTTGGLPGIMGADIVARWVD